MSNFPPETDHPREVQAVLEFLKSIVGAEKAAYMSAPITSGKRIVELHSNGTNSDEDKTDKIEQAKQSNIEHAKEISIRLKEKCGGILIDPTLVDDISDWRQNDYRFAWGEIIKNFVKAAYFVDDWHYSNGCSFEFLIAKQFNIETFNENLEPMSVKDGILLIQKAVEEHQSHNLPTNFQKSVLIELSELETEQAKIFV